MSQIGEHDATGRESGGKTALRRWLQRGKMNDGDLGYHAKGDGDYQREKITVPHLKDEPISNARQKFDAARQPKPKQRTRLERKRDLKARKIEAKKQGVWPGHVEVQEEPSSNPSLADAAKADAQETVNWLKGLLPTVNKKDDIASAPMQEHVEDLTAAEKRHWKARKLHARLSALEEDFATTSHGISNKAINEARIQVSLVSGKLTAVTNQLLMLQLEAVTEDLCKADSGVLKLTISTNSEQQSQPKVEEEESYMTSRMNARMRQANSDQSMEDAKQKLVNELTNKRFRIICAISENMTSQQVIAAPENASWSYAANGFTPVVSEKHKTTKVKKVRLTQQEKITEALEEIRKIKEEHISDTRMVEMQEAYNRVWNESVVNLKSLEEELDVLKAELTETLLISNSTLERENLDDRRRAQIARRIERINDKIDVKYGEVMEARKLFKRINQTDVDEIEPTEEEQPIEEIANIDDENKEKAVVDTLKSHVFGQLMAINTKLSEKSNLYGDHLAPMFSDAPVWNVSTNDVAMEMSIEKAVINIDTQLKIFSSRTKMERSPQLCSHCGGTHVRNRAMLEKEASVTRTEQSILESKLRDAQHKLNLAWIEMLDAKIDHAGAFEEVRLLEAQRLCIVWQEALDMEAIQVLQDIKVLPKSQHERLSKKMQELRIRQTEIRQLSWQILTTKDGLKTLADDIAFLDQLELPGTSRLPITPGGGNARLKHAGASSVGSSITDMFLGKGLSSEKYYDSAEQRKPGVIKGFLRDIFREDSPSGFKLPSFSFSWGDPEEEENMKKQTDRRDAPSQDGQFDVSSEQEKQEGVQEDIQGQQHQQGAEENKGEENKGEENKGEESRQSLETQPDDIAAMNTELHEMQKQLLGIPRSERKQMQEQIDLLDATVKCATVKRTMARRRTDVIEDVPGVTEATPHSKWSEYPMSVRSAASGTARSSCSTALISSREICAPEDVPCETERNALSARSEYSMSARSAVHMTARTYCSTARMSARSVVSVSARATEAHGVVHVLKTQYDSLSDGPEKKAMMQEITIAENNAITIQVLKDEYDMLPDGPKKEALAEDSATAAVQGLKELHESVPEGAEKEALKEEIITAEEIAKEHVNAIPIFGQLQKETAETTVAETRNAASEMVAMNAQLQEQMQQEHNSVSRSERGKLQEKIDELDAAVRHERSSLDTNQSETAVAVAAAAVEMQRAEIDAMPDGPEKAIVATALEASTLALGECVEGTMVAQSSQSHDRTEVTTAAAATAGVITKLEENGFTDEAHELKLIDFNQSDAEALKKHAERISHIARQVKPVGHIDLSSEIQVISKQVFRAAISKEIVESDAQHEEALSSLAAAREETAELNVQLHQLQQELLSLPRNERKELQEKIDALDATVKTKCNMVGTLDKSITTSRDTGSVDCADLADNFANMIENAGLAEESDIFRLLANDLRTKDMQAMRQRLEDIEQFTEILYDTGSMTEAAAATDLIRRVQVILWDACDDSSVPSIAPDTNNAASEPQTEAERETSMLTERLKEKRKELEDVKSKLQVTNAKLVRVKKAEGKIQAEVHDLRQIHSDAMNEKGHADTYLQETGLGSKVQMLQHLQTECERWKEYGLDSEDSALDRWAAESKELNEPISLEPKGMYRESCDPEDEVNQSHP